MLRANAHWSRTLASDDAARQNRSMERLPGIRSRCHSGLPTWLRPPWTLWGFQRAMELALFSLWTTGAGLRPLIRAQYLVAGSENAGGRA